MSNRPWDLRAQNTIIEGYFFNDTINHGHDDNTKSTVLAINSIYAQVRAPEWVKRWHLSSILLGVVYLNSSLPLGKDLRYLCFPLREKYYLEMHKKSIYAKYGALNASFDG